MKPSVFNTANSAVLSRSACAIVCAAITTMLKNTAPRTAVTMAAMLPTWLANPCRNRPSLDVLVGPDDAANSSSMADKTSSDRPGSPRRATKSPTDPLIPGTPSSRKS